MPIQPPDAIESWQMEGPGQPLVHRSLPLPALGAGDVLVEVAGCGVCHTDLGFLFDGVKTRAELPLTLGHEISGRVVATGASATALEGRTVVVPSVIPCGTCDLCRGGRANACRSQLMPGNDFHGGFASHIQVPARFLCPVDDLRGFDLAELAVIADAVTTPYMAIRRADVREGDVCICVGVGGVGGYAVQIAAALGAHVLALDIDQAKLDRLRDYGARWVLNTRDRDARQIRTEVRGLLRDEGLPPHGWKVFETSGTAAGQEAAYALLSFAGVLSVVGFTMEKVTLRLSNLMAFDAAAVGTWGCLPEYYPDAVALALDGKIQVRPFSSRHPMSRINEIFASVRDHALDTRAILEPDF